MVYEVENRNDFGSQLSQAGDKLVVIGSYNMLTIEGATDHQDEIFCIRLNYWTTCTECNRSGHFKFRGSFNSNFADFLDVAKIILLKFGNVKKVNV